LGDEAELRDDPGPRGSASNEEYNDVTTCDDDDDLMDVKAEPTRDDWKAVTSSERRSTAARSRKLITE
jgi:hypothetical protein